MKKISLILLIALFCSFTALAETTTCSDKSPNDVSEVTLEVSSWNNQADAQVILSGPVIDKVESNCYPKEASFTDNGKYKLSAYVGIENGNFTSVNIKAERTSPLCSFFWENGVLVMRVWNTIGWRFNNGCK